MEGKTLGRVIMKAAQGHGVRVFFGQDEVAQRLVDLPDEEQMQPQLSSLYIQQEVALLSRTSAPKAKTPQQASLEVGDGWLVIRHVDMVNICVTIGPDAGASLPGVQSQ